MSSKLISIPVVDIGPFMTSEINELMRSGTASLMKEACSRFGAFHLKGHGMDTSRILQKMKEFFALPEEIKQSFTADNTGMARGYIGMGKESGSDLLEVKEAFSYGHKWTPDEKLTNEMQAENIWPPAGMLPPDWQESMEKFYVDMCGVAEAMTKAFAKSFDQPEDHLSGYCRGGETISMMRLFHYYPYEAADRDFLEKKDRIGSSPHTDWGFLTLILQQEDVSGLQIYHDGDWYDIVPEPGALTVNCGDYFSLLTGGQFISPLHRVVSAGRERMSAVLFYYPSYDARIPLLGKQTYSLFSDQQEKGGNISKDELMNKSFGQFIAEKWQQVKRN